MASSFNLLTALLLLYAPTSCHAHGRMLEPCGRATYYICGLGAPPNYNDHEMNCGGRVVQWDQNGGKCGICGDPYPGEHPHERPNGYMVQHKIISETYLENQVINLRLQITVGHGGYHEFRICNVAHSGGVEATQECLDKTLLADENGNTKFHTGTTTAGYYDYTLVLPKGLTCTQCVIQWKWKCGNDWGCFPNGQCCTGCGYRQEEFYGCSDVTINPRDFRPNVTSQSTSALTSSSTTSTTATSKPTTTTRLSTTTTTTTPPSTTTPFSTTTPQSTTSVLLSTLSSSTKSSPSTTTTASTTVTTTTTAASTTKTSPTTTKTTQAPVKIPGNSFQQNRLNQIPGLKNMTNGNSIEYYNKNTNSAPIKYTSTEEFLNMIMGNKTSMSLKAVSAAETSQTVWESEEKMKNDRICAMCATKNCYLNICRTSCPDVPPCTTFP